MDPTLLLIAPSPAPSLAPSLGPLPQDDEGDGENEGEDEGDPRQDVAVAVPSLCVGGVKLRCVNGGGCHYTQACRRKAGKDEDMRL